LRATLDDDGGLLFVDEPRCSADELLRVEPELAERRRVT
jgi:hypothetical protein